MDLKEKFGKKVKELRKAHGLSQEAFAHKVGIDRTYMPSIEKGKRNISITVAEKIAKALNMKISELFNAVESDILPNKTNLK